MVFLILLIVSFLTDQANASVKWKPNMKSFTHSVKQGGCEENREISLFEYTKGPGVITEQWYTGSGCINLDTIIRYYIDGAKKPTIEFNLYMAQGIGYVDDRDPGVPWGNRRFGHVSHKGGLYNTFRVPFQKSIYISMISKHEGAYYYNIRGMRNYPVIIGDIELPSNAKLMLYKKENVTLQPFEYITLASSTSKNGLLYQLTFNTESKNYLHQEACFRVINDKSGKIKYLSSGTEDLFLSSYYFNGGIFHTDQAGLSFKEYPARSCAYKFFEDDPVLFANKFKLTWRCGELLDNKCYKSQQRHCSRKYGNDDCVTEKDREATSLVNEANTNFTMEALIYSYVWTYEW